MSSHEDETPQVDAKSSIRVTRNAKGFPQFEVKVVAGESDERLDAMRRQAVAQYQALGNALGGAQ